MRPAIAWGGNCLGLLVASALVPGISYSHDAGTLLLAGAVLALVNVAIRPLVIAMALPALLLTLGLALLLVNTFMLWLTSEIVSGLRVGGFWSTLAAALVISVVNVVLRREVGPPRRARLRFGLRRSR
jgi:putative membrane protein